MNEQEIRKANNWHKSPNPNIIVDRKKKKYTFMMDDQVSDPFGLEQGAKNRANTISIERGSEDTVDKFLIENPDPKSLLGKKVWCFKRDKSRVFCGWVVDVYPSRYLLVKVNGDNMPMSFDSVFAIGE